MTKKDMINMIQEREKATWHRYKVNFEYFGEDSDETKRANEAWFTIFTLMSDLGIELR